MFQDPNIEHIDHLILTNKKKKKLFDDNWFPDIIIQPNLAAGKEPSYIFCLQILYCTITTYIYISITWVKHKNYFKKVGPSVTLVLLSPGFSTQIADRSGYSAEDFLLFKVIMPRYHSSILELASLYSF